MKRAELEIASAQYGSQVEKSLDAEKSGHLKDAMKLAQASWPHIPAMMQYERKRGTNRFETLEGIEIVLRCAPIVFDFEGLSALEDFVDGHRRIQKHISVDLSDCVATARALMAEAQQLWNQLEGVESLGCRDADDANIGKRHRQIAGAWERLGILLQSPGQPNGHLSFCTSLDEPTRGKCSSCGVIARAPKRKLLQPARCPKCGHEVYFVILANQETV